MYLCNRCAENMGRAKEELEVDSHQNDIDNMVLIRNAISKYCEMLGQRDCDTGFWAQVSMQNIQKILGMS